MEETCIRFGQHGARVMIEEKEIPHYAIHVDPVKKEVSCWIASEAGKAFSVIWLELDVDYPTSGTLHLDGHSAICSLRRRTGPKVLQYIPVSKSSHAPLLFSPLVVTDDDTYLDNSPSHSIGEIKLVIDRTTEVVKRKPTTTVAAYLAPRMVHERSKKATVHRVGYGTEIPRPKATHTAKPLETLVTFIFKYRPLEMLHANDIVPRNPELLEYSKLKKEPESDDDSDEDSMREKALLAEVQRCQAEVEKIREARGYRSKDSERPEKKLKKEERPSSFFTPGEIIDLT